MTSPEWLTQGPLFGLPLADLWFGLVFFILGTFLFLDGFDFGVGAVFATLTDDHHREQFLAAIGPFWDGNEVWLVVFGGALFAAFPAVYGTLFSRHYLLMFAILGALILRGLAPEFYEQRDDAQWTRWWGRAFVVGSILTPFFLGMFMGNWLVGATQLVTVAGLLVGMVVVALTVVDGVAYLRVKLRGDLRDTLQRTGVWAIGVYLALVVVTIAYLAGTEPTVQSDVTSPPILSLIAVTLILGGVYVGATLGARYYLAFGSAAGLVYALVAIVAMLMYPTLDRVTGLTVADAIVSTIPLNLMTIGAAILLPLVFLYFVVLYSAFSGPIDPDETY